MKKLLTLAALFVIIGTAIVGCKASAEIDDSTSISMPR